MCYLERCTVGFVALFIWPLCFVKKIRQKQVSKLNLKLETSLRQRKSCSYISLLLSVQSFQKLVDIAEEASVKTHRIKYFLKTTLNIIIHNK